MNRNFELPVSCDREEALGKEVEFFSQVLSAKIFVRESYH